MILILYFTCTIIIIYISKCLTAIGCDHFIDSTVNGNSRVGRWPRGKEYWFITLQIILNLLNSLLLINKPIVCNHAQRYFLLRYGILVLCYLVALTENRVSQNPWVRIILTKKKDKFLFSIYSSLNYLFVVEYTSCNHVTSYMCTVPCQSFNYGMLHREMQNTWRKNEIRLTIKDDKYRSFNRHAHIRLFFGPVICLENAVVTLWQIIKLALERIAKCRIDI